MVGCASQNLPIAEMEVEHVTETFGYGLEYSSPTFSMGPYIITNSYVFDLDAPMWCLDGCPLCNAAEATSPSYVLLKMCMNAPMTIYEPVNALDVGAIEFGEIPVFQNHLCYRLT